VVFSGGLEDARERLEGWRREEDRAAASSELPLADVRVTVAVRPQPRLRVVEMQRTEALEPDLGGDLARDGVDARRCSNVIAGREQVA
jgi:hypothetical protein